MGIGLFQMRDDGRRGHSQGSRDDSEEKDWEKKQNLVHWSRYLRKKSPPISQDDEDSTYQDGKEWKINVLVQGALGKGRNLISCTKGL